MFSCTDGISEIKSTNKIREDTRINCFINQTNSKVELKDGKFSIEAHFVRPFKTDDISHENLTDNTGQDLQLEAGLIIGAQLRVAIP